MLRIVSSSKLISIIPENCYQNFQSVRWRRKPIWMPTAKSKMFRVPVKPEIPLEEKEELKRLFNNYRTQIKSIRRFLTYKHSVLLQAQADTELLQKAFDEDFARCAEINEKWNAELKQLREERIAKELAEEIEFAKNRMARLLELKHQKLAEAEEIVRREKAAAASFITPENLDEVIEKAISNPTDYNFAIDLEGNRIYGRETKPEENVSVKQ